MRSSSPDLQAASTPLEWRANLMLFLGTVASVFVTGVVNFSTPASPDTAAPNGFRLEALTAPFFSHDALVHGSQFTASLLTILVAHELGHYVAARIHKVDASLPFFIPMPLLSPFGTMGAVIRMRGTIPTRAALLDIGASGPLAGLAFALPMYFYGAAHSKVVPVAGAEGMVELGDSLALRVMDHFSRAPIPEGMELQLSPMAFAAWAGMFVTMINLLPVAQLDGGHVAYALFGTRQDRIGQTVHRAMLAFFFVLVGGDVLHDLRLGFGLHRIGAHVGNGMFWLVWFEMLAILGSLSSARRDGGPEAGTLTVRTRLVAMLGLVVLASVGREHESPLLWIVWFLGLGLLLAMEVRGGALRKTTLLDHPPTGRAPLGVGRAAVAILTLLFFVLLFMPRPISM